MRCLRLRVGPDTFAPLRGNSWGGSKLQVVSWDVVNGYIKVCDDEAGSEAAVVGSGLEVGWIAIKHVSGSNRGQPFKALLNEVWYPCHWQCHSQDCAVWVSRGGNETIDDIESFLIQKSPK